MRKVDLENCMSVGWIIRCNNGSFENTTTGKHLTHISSSTYICHSKSRISCSLFSRCILKISRGHKVNVVSGFLHIIYSLFFTVY